MENFSYYPDEESETKPYEFFKYQLEREELFKYSVTIAEYLRRESVPNLVIIDRSSRPLYVAIKEYFKFLKTMYPDETEPNIYFMNPKGFKAREDISQHDAIEINRDAVFKDDVDESIDQVRSRAEIMQELTDTYKRLMETKDKPVLIFDTCIHTGKSLSPVKNALESNGFQDIRVGSVNPSRSPSLKTDFYITQQRPEKGCYPFDHDKMIEKTFNHVYSDPTNDVQKRETSIALRQEIKRIMKEYLEPYRQK